MMRRVLTKQGYDRRAPVDLQSRSNGTTIAWSTCRWFRSPKKKSPPALMKGLVIIDLLRLAIDRRSGNSGQRALIQGMFRPPLRWVDQKTTLESCFQGRLPFIRESLGSSVTRPPPMTDRSNGGFCRWAQLTSLCCAPIPLLGDNDSQVQTGPYLIAINWT